MVQTLAAHSGLGELFEVLVGDFDKLRASRGVSFGGRFEYLGQVHAWSLQV